jgi:Protein of unknown function (DUF2934)
MKKMKQAQPVPVPPASAIAGSCPSHEAITKRAEALWLQKGRPEGRDEQIWLEAERQLSHPSGSDGRKGGLAPSLPLSRLDLNSDDVMSELGELFPEPSGKETTSL